MNKSASLLLAASLFVPLRSIAATIWTENFDYADGSLTNVSSSLWTTHSGTGTPILVGGGQVTGMSAGAGSREDSNRVLDTSYSTGVLFAGFDITLSSTPVSSAYFLHFKDGTASGFRGRVFLGSPTTSGFRLGLDNDGGDNGATIAFTSDLVLGATYHVILAYDTGAGTSRLWVNNTTEALPDLLDTAAASLLTITSLGLRQGATAPAEYTGLNLDNLVVATDFASVVPEPSTIALLGGFGLLAFALVRRRR